MIINYDIEKLSSALEAFYAATGIGIQLLDRDCSSLNIKFFSNPYCTAVQATKCGKAACRASDARLLELCKSSRKTATNVCHAGLIDVAVPIIYDSEIISYIILGQLRPEKDVAGLEDYLLKLGAKVSKDDYAALQIYDPYRVQGVARLAEMLTKYILLENMVQPNYSDRTERALAFIEENLHHPFSVEDICKSAYVSKSVLYQNFSRLFGCTVGEYVTRKRIERSLRLLEGTDLSVEEISQQAGFSSAAYFTVNFKKIMGVPPIKYRKEKSVRV